VKIILEINKIYNIDCIEGMKLLDDNSVDSIVTDPPYELGFMGKKWDNTGIAYNIEVWKEALRVLKPGGYLLSFGGTRTYHRMACAIEDAGFEIRDQIQWIYGSGFPKSLDISKSLEKRRCTIDIGKWILERMKILNLDKKEIAKYCNVTPRQIDHWIGINTPCPQNPKQDKYLLLEEILQDKPIWREQFIEKHGDKSNDKIHSRSGGNDFAKIVGSKSNKKIEEIYKLETQEAQQWEGWGTALKPAHEPIVVARKPLSEKTVAENVLKYSTGGINIDECRIYRDINDKSGWSISGSKESENMAMSGKNYTRPPKEDNTKGRFPANVIFDEEAGKMLDKQSGILKSGARKGKNNINSMEQSVSIGNGWRYTGGKCDSSEGGASRFFYCAKTSKKERGEGNNHPTVKPLSLIKYLITLVTPPNGICLDPFEGSGTHAIASKELGFNYIGFEKDTTYCGIIEKRIQNTVSNVQ